VDRAFINLDDCDFDSRNSYSGDKVKECLKLSIFTRQKKPPTALEF